MNIFKYITKSLWYFRKQHFAVFLGTIVSTAVLTGALIIGDSVKYSLHDLVNLRLGQVEYAMPAGDRYVRAELAKEIQADLNGNAAALLQVKAIAIQPENQTRTNNIQAYGVDQEFWKFSFAQQIDLKDGEAAVSSNLADKMSLKIGDEFLLRIEKGSLIPANAPFVSDEDQTIALRVKVKAIAGDHELGRFSLKNNQLAPYNVFLSRDYLAKEMELEGRANLLLASSAGESVLSLPDVEGSLKKNWNVKDAGLEIRSVKGKDQLELISDRVFIDTPISDEIEKIAVNQQTLLTYFVNRISCKDKETPYSFVSAINGDSRLSDLSDGEMIINQWLAEDLGVKVGDSISLDYFVIGALRALEKQTQTFVVKEILPLDSDLLDQDMMPSFPGLSDAGSCNEWEAGVPVDFSKIRPKDEDYWKQYKGTPKALISPTKAVELWSNKYGKYTAFRFNEKELSQNDLEKLMLSVMNPNLLNLSFVSVRDAGVLAANNMVDFGELFLSLSFFIIFAGVLLTILIYSLNLDSRSQENGILLSLGFPKSQILPIRVYESLVTVVVGGLVGVLGGVLYNQLLLKALNSVWTDVVRTNMLNVHLRGTTLFTGFAIGLVVAMLCIWWLTRKKLKKTASNLIQNTTDENIFAKGSRISKLIALISILGAAAIITYAFASSLDQNAELLLSAGGLFMIGACAFVHMYLQKLSSTRSSKTPSLLQLAIKNSARNRRRSLASVALLALGTFSVLITGANRKTFFNTENADKSGTGGYEYWIESTMPVLFDLNTAEGLEKAGFWKGDIDSTAQFVQFRALEGDDASCLNLNQVQKPRILGFDPMLFDKKDAFSFAALAANVDSEHPWQALNKDLGENVIPAYADQTVIVWGLKKAVGDTLIYQNEFGKDIKLVLMGGLNNSIFQGNILISDNQFQKHFPSISGSKILLIDSQNDKDDQLMQEFENNLQDLGVSGMKTSDRLAAFYSVENTYLSMFMFLGGLGVIIGTIGLGIVLMRNILERKKELALLSAIGYQQKSLFKLLFYENLFLLLAGLACGLGAALIGVLPSLLSPSFHMPVGYILTLLFGILISGLIWIWIPARQIKKYNIVESLKNE
ncbi:FtsX-like permease family protein [Labilibaculum sp. A4]|uniref:ABC transporter permease n=1 Tax=Labilibaculum euxinus TaxID=2686357 RepID=UPI000F6200F9|nr:ABC transporter permease [Labilibaculum euxinus]MDQ1770449.1 ABC transporter permease [Labilibaculum euxinus]MWN75332.1 FtsX-like permease family protein [Labilibaculum euxinus]